MEDVPGESQCTSNAKGAEILKEDCSKALHCLKSDMKKEDDQRGLSSYNW